MEIEPGKDFVKTWRVENTGSTSWGKGFHLVFAQGHPMTDILGHPVQSVPPGSQADISISLTSPSTPGTYFGDWYLQDDLGNRFGEVLFLRIVVTKFQDVIKPVPSTSGVSAARYLEDVNVPDGTRMKAGSEFVKRWRVENTGTTTWGEGFHIVHVGRDPLTTQLSQPLTPAIPGQQVDVSVSLVTPENSGNYVSQWRMQDEHGQIFGELLFLEINVVPEIKTSWKFDPPAWKKAIWSITSIFESGKAEGDPAAYQTVDAGIISYGKHQATLGSGTLNRVVEAFLRRSNSPTSQALKQEYAERIAKGDASLRNDGRLRQLLLQAAAEPEMNEAQDEVFDQNFYQPVIAQARKYNISSPLGLACLYDTQIQGGLFILLPRVTEKLGGIVGESGPKGVIDEATWIGTFLDLREERLLKLAEQNEAAGQTVNADALRISTFRVQEYRKLLQANNLTLEGELTIRTRKVQGITVV